MKIYTFNAIFIARSRARRVIKENPACSAFTLVELLVVIAIIGLLMSLMLPTIDAALERARAATCQSRLRQMGAATLAYAADHDGQLYYRLTSNPLRQMWFTSLYPYLGIDGQPNELDKMTDAYRCPSDPYFNDWVHPQFTGVGVWPYDRPSHGYNYYLGPDGRTDHGGPAPRTRLSQVPRPGQMILLADSGHHEESGASSYVVRMQSTSLMIWPRHHGGAANLLWLSGHVESGVSGPRLEAINHLAPYWQPREQR